jgi:hypothetical protein
MLKFFSKAAAPAGPKPRAPRDEFECSATVCAGGAFHRARLCDVSASGCKIALAHPLPPGERIQIALEAYHSLGGTVRWCREGMAGIQFGRPLSDAVLLTWKDAVAKARNAPPPAPKRRRNFLGEAIFTKKDEE